MPGFESIIDQERPIRILTTLLQNGTLPHALLFTGIEGVGKQAAAIALAMTCNCQGENSGFKPKDKKIQDARNDYLQTESATPDACGYCKSCRKIESGNHPDIIQIKPSGPFIKIAQIRALCHTFAMKPYEASIRVAIISDAQTMNPAAGNALLKILEEPPDRTILLLIATQRFGLLPTIVSRCRHIRFNPISGKNLIAWLQAKHGLDAADASIIATLANGSFSRALHMFRHHWVQRRNWLLHEIESLSCQPLGRLFAFAEKLSRDKEALPDTLDVIKSWLRDLVIGKYCLDKIINQDHANKIEMASQKSSTESLLSKIETVQRTQNRIQANTNLRLTLEVLLLKLAQT